MSRSRFLVAALVAIAALPAARAADVTTDATLSVGGARRVLSAARAEARRLAAPGAAIAVVDRGGHLLASERLDGTFAAGATVSLGKARTAAEFQKPTSVFEDVINGGRTAMAAVDFTPLKGGVPIESGGRIVGAIGVSGAASAAQDEEIARAGADALAEAPGGAPVSAAGAIYVPAPRVRAAFEAGGVLVDDPEDGVMVHASRRDEPGMAEIHWEDTDVIHVLAGTATLVTGGTVERPKVTAPGETRGARITGGTAHRLAPGDVLVVPSGVPHWFSEVPGPFTYFVVKAR